MTDTAHAETRQDMVVAERPRTQIMTGGSVGGLVPQSLDEAYRLAQWCAKSGLTPRGIDTPEKCLYVIMAGSDLKMPPVQSLQSYAMVNNRLSLWGDAIPALLLSNGFKLREWLDNSDPSYPDNMTARCEITRPDGQVFEGEFSVADAKEAKLWTKEGSWQSARKRMLKMRARAFCARDGAADLLRGVYIAEEAQDIPPAVAEAVGTGMVDRLKSRPAEVDAAGFNVRQIAADTDAAAPKRSRKSKADAAPAQDADTGEVIDAHFTTDETVQQGVEINAQGETDPAASNVKADDETPVADDLSATLGGDDLPASIKGDDLFPGDQPAPTAATEPEAPLAPSDDVQEGVAGPGEVYFLASDRELDAAGKRATFKDGAPFSRSTPKDEIMVYDDHAPAPLAEPEAAPEFPPSPIREFILALHTFPTWDAEKAAIAALYRTDEWNEAEPKEQAAVFLAAWTRAAELKVDPGADAPAFRVWVMTSTDEEAITGTYAYLKKGPAYQAMVQGNPAAGERLDAIVAARLAAIRGAK